MNKFIFFSVFLILISGIFSCKQIVETAETQTFVVEKQEEVIQEPEPEEPEVVKKLTLLVYMAADNDLESYGIQNFKQMERAVFDNMNVVVLFDRSEEYDETNGNWTDTRLFEVVHDGSNSGVLVSNQIECPELGLTTENQTELDMGNYRVLSGFIDFAKEKYDTEKYALIVWGHGTGWRYGGGSDCGSGCSVDGRAVAIDDKSDSYISVKELGLAVGGKGLSVIGFDTCFGGVIENVYELKDACDYVVASPGVTPCAGWDYTKMLEAMAESDFESESLAAKMAESSSVKTSVYAAAKIDGLMEKFEVFSKALSQTVTTTERRNEVFNQLFDSKKYTYSQYPCDMYLDIYQMAGLYVTASDSELAAAAGDLQTALGACGYTTQNDVLGLGVNFIPLQSASTVAAGHSAAYLKKSEDTTQSSFIQDSQWWVPTEKGTSDSLLDKLFYRVF